MGNSTSLNDLNFIVSLVSVISSAMIGALALYISHRQSTTNHAAVRLALYDRRLVVYHALNTFLLALMRDADLTLQVLGEFAERTSDRAFLFGPDVVDYLDKVRRTATQVRATKSRLDAGNLVVGSPERMKIADEYHAALAWLAEQLEGPAEQMFVRYIGFSTLHADRFGRLRAWLSATRK